MGLFIFIGFFTAIAACLGVWGVIQLYKQEKGAKNQHVG